MYGNEQEVGAAIQAKIADGTIKREDIFVTTKVRDYLAVIDTFSRFERDTLPILH